MKGSLVLYNLKLNCLISSTGLNSSLIIFIQTYTVNSRNALYRLPCSYEHYLVKLSFHPMSIFKDKLFVTLPCMILKCVKFTLSVYVCQFADYVEIMFRLCSRFVDALGEPQRPCSRCSAIFDSDWDLAEHIAAHDDGQSLICPMCQQKFTSEMSQDVFEAHVQSHFD